MGEKKETTMSEPVKNPVLSSLLKKYNETPAENREEKNNRINDVAAEFVENARLLLPVQIDEKFIEKTGPNAAVIKKDGRFNVTVLTAGDGTKYYPLFTDWQEIARCPDDMKKNIQTFIVSFDDLWALLQNIDAGAVINPFSDNLAFNKETLRRFHEHKELKTSGHTEHQVEKDTKVMLGDPAEDPKPLKDALRSTAENYPEIRNMWLKLMIKEDEKSWLLIVDHKGDKTPLFEALSKAAAGHLAKGMYIDMISYSDSFGKRAADGNPFYVRKKKGLFF